MVLLGGLEVQGSVAVVIGLSTSTGSTFSFTSHPSQKTRLSFSIFCLCVFSQCFVYILFFFPQLWKCYEGCVDASGLISSICGGVSMNLCEKTLFFRLMLLS